MRPSEKDCCTKSGLAAATNTGRLAGGLGWRDGACLAARTKERHEFPDGILRVGLIGRKPDPVLGDRDTAALVIARVLRVATAPHKRGGWRRSGKLYVPFGWKVGVL
jgi:hypothetical protein